jgi:hypothetical protein
MILIFSFDSCTEFKGGLIVSMCLTKNHKENELSQVSMTTINKVTYILSNSEPVFLISNGERVSLENGFYVTLFFLF